MKNKTLTFYGAESKLTPKHQELKTPDGDSYFIRITESHDGETAALDHAKPKRGESVLNTLNVGI